MNDLFKPHLTFDKYLSMPALGHALCWMLETEEKEISEPESQVTRVTTSSSHPTYWVTMSKDLGPLIPVPIK